MPVAVDDEFLNGIEDQSYQFTLADLTSNDSDVEGDAFSITSLTNLNPESGALNVDLAAGTAGFVPNADFNGEVRFSYILTETATGIESQANGRVVFAPQDDTATLSDKSFTINEDEVTLFGNAMLLDVLQDADGEALSITGVALDDPAAGTLTVLADGVRFEPTAHFFGDAGFSFDASDGVTSQTLRAEVTVTEVNDAPVAVEDRLTGALEETDYQITVADLLANDSDVEGDALELASVEVVDSATGSLVWDQPAGLIQFSPAANGRIRWQQTA